MNVQLEIDPVPEGMRVAERPVDLVQLLSQLCMVLLEEDQ